MTGISPYKSQQGVALITVLLVVALVVIIATQMTSRLQLTVTRAINQQMFQQGLWSALAGEQMVFKVLEQDYKDDKDTVNLQQQWAIEGMIFPLGDGKLAGEVKDLHSCFNLNYLAKKVATGNNHNLTQPQRQLQALFLSLEIDDYIAEQLVATIGDWVDDNSQLSGSLGAEDDNYASRQIPYLAANSPMVTVTELMAIEGMTGAVYRKIRPHICVIPQDEELVVNVNTIKDDNAHLLVAMFEGKLDLSSAKSVLASREEDGFADLEAFFNSPEITSTGTLNDEFKKQFQLTSKHFRAVLNFTADKQKLTLESIFQRSKDGKLVVISRQFGDIE